jgi:hypothetical protein
MSSYRYVSRILLAVILFLVGSISTNFASAQGNSRIYLPFVEKDAQYGFGTEAKFIGVYMQTYWNNQTAPELMNIANELAGGKKHSVTGWFYDIHDPHPQPNFRGQLEALWVNGYVSFINLNSNATAYEIASGQLDGYLVGIAQNYATWIGLGGGRRAFLAPLPEMNGVNSDGNPWASYGGDPVNFKLAYQRIQNIFAQNGIRRDQAWWVFAPNGWSKVGHEFEIYYPGDSLVDVLAFSMYNYGFCSVAYPWPKWENYNTLYAPYLSRMRVMAPDKPVIIAQTGSTSQYWSSGDNNVAMKNLWLQENYAYLSNQPTVLGILYYDLDQSSWECNWKITGGNTYKPGYSAGVGVPVFQYLDWRVLQSIIP